MPIEWPDWTRRPEAENVFYVQCPSCGSLVSRLGGLSYHQCVPPHSKRGGSTPKPLADKE
jgi:hypothetical protein